MNLTIDLIRHSEAKYKTYLRLLEVNPCGSFDSIEHIYNDLTNNGTQLAETKAIKYFDACKDDSIIFTSSNEARAIETANIFSGIASGKGFSVGNLLLKEELSVNPKMMLLNVIFSTNKQHGDLNINWNLVPNSVKSKYLSLRKDIEKEDTGSWMQNVIQHSSLVTSIFPENDLSLNEYRNQFNQAIRDLINLGLNNKHSNRVLAFTHENVLAPIMADYFQSSDFHNCENITFIINDDNQVLCRFRDQEKLILPKSKKDLL
jgi:broad specificity phosphatase PhoE